jgi:hypothetical protein
MKLNKTQLAQVVITALYDRPRLVPADHWAVKARVRLTKDVLIHQYILAVRALKSVGREHLADEIWQ